ncbi:Uncharacterised protein [Mycobacteroides abscessus subsp. abscessus]|nr:Uncharacterised protein [Mycobacteroides abscessus subsp. abscessus]
MGPVTVLPSGASAATLMNVSMNGLASIEPPSSISHISGADEESV